MSSKELARAAPVTKSAFDRKQATRAYAKPDYTELVLPFLQRVVERSMLGQLNYGRDNWKKGGAEFLHDCCNHAFEHLVKYMEGDTTEDHLGAIGWFVMCMSWHENAGTLSLGIKEAIRLSTEAKRERFLKEKANGGSGVDGSRNAKHQTGKNGKGRGSSLEDAHG